LIAWKGAFHATSGKFATLLTRITHVPGRAGMLGFSADYLPGAVVVVVVVVPVSVPPVAMTRTTATANPPNAAGVVSAVPCRTVDSV